MNAATRIDNLRVPPHSQDSEQAVLGGLMLDSTALPLVSDWLNENDFFRRDHQLIYRAINELATRGQPCDPVTMGEWFETNGLAEIVGGSAYILQLSNSTPSAANVAAYAEIVREKSRLRELINRGTEMARKAFASRADASLIATEASNAITALVGDVRAGGLAPLKKSVAPWFVRLHERYEQQLDMTGLPTPWRDLNALTLGLQPGDLIVIPGRTSIGKSVAGFQLATHAALNGNPTAVFSLEMRAEQFLQRAIAAFGRIPHEHLRLPKKMAEEEWPTVTAMMNQLSASPLTIDDQPSLTAQQIVARLKRQHMRTPLKLAVIDHLHEIKRPGRDPVNEIGDAVRTLRSAAKELRIPLVLLAQLNRNSTQRTDHRPTVDDLRGSGSIEEIADVILLLHRQDARDPDTHLKGVVEMILGKGRDLPVGEIVYLKNSYDQMRLDDWEGDLPKRPAAKKKGKGSHPDDDSSDDYVRATRGE